MQKVVRLPGSHVPTTFARKHGEYNPFELTQVRKSVTIVPCKPETDLFH